MATTRTRDGTLPSRTYEAVIRGTRVRDRDGASIEKLPRGRPRKVSKPIDEQGPANKDPNHPHSPSNLHIPPQIICRLKVPNFTDEIGRILGDADEPYYGLFKDMKGGSSAERTTPTAEDRALYCQLSGGSMRNMFTKGPSIIPTDTSLNTTKLAIHFGEAYTMDAWYHSAYPTEYTRRDYLAICSYCLDYMVSDLTAERHMMKCCRRVPPGREIYRDGDISMWEVDGTNASLYCQNLCLLAKAFLSSKSLYRDVQPFYFYVLTKKDKNGNHFLGYFSKQKMYSLFRPSDPIQCVSCIMALPFTQQKGYGQFLIEFSYLLTYQQQATGSPETPLSELGERSFRGFWKRRVCYQVKHYLDSKISFTLTQLSRDTAIHINHIVVALEDLGWLTKTGSQTSNPILKICPNKMEEIIQKWESRNPLKIRKELLLWVPLYE